MFPVACAFNPDLGDRVLDGGEIARAEFHAGGGEVFLQTMPLGGAGIGAVQGRWASSQASAIWRARHPSLSGDGAA